MGTQEITIKHLCYVLVAYLMALSACKNEVSIYDQIPGTWIGREESTRLDTSGFPLLESVREVELDFHSDGTAVLTRLFGSFELKDSMFWVVLEEPRMMLFSVIDTVNHSSGSGVNYGEFTYDIVNIEPGEMFLERKVEFFSFHSESSLWLRKLQ